MPDTDAQWEGREDHRPSIFLAAPVARLHTGESICEVDTCDHPAIWATRIAIPDGFYGDIAENESFRAFWDTDNEGGPPFSILTIDGAIFCDCHMAQTFLAASQMKMGPMDIHFTDEHFCDDPEFRKYALSIAESHEACAEMLREVTERMRVVDQKNQRASDRAAEDLIRKGVMTQETRKAVEDAIERGDKGEAIRLLVQNILPNVIKNMLGEDVTVTEVGRYGPFSKQPQLPSLTSDDALDAFDALSDAETLGDLFGDIPIDFDN